MNPQMGGKDARDGFWFQDAKALTRLLADVLERRRRQFLGLELGPELRVRVESPVLMTVDPDDEEDAPHATPTRTPWDGTFSVGDHVIVDECKLGGASREDRVTFYRRLRATVEQGVPVGQLTPRLTVGRDRVSDAERWRGLGAAAQAIAAAAGPFKRADTVEKRAAEALYYLTAPAPVWKLKRRADERNVGKTSAVRNPAPLSLDDARALLARFDLDDTSSLDDVETELHTLVEASGAAVLVDELILFLRGWIDTHARTREGGADLTAESLTEQLSVIARHLNVPVAVEQLWNRLRETVAPPPVTAITEQPWREVQPHIDEVVHARARSSRVAFTSDGGMGKSFLLGALHAEQRGTRVWIEAVAPLQDVEQALAVGAWATQRGSDELTVFVDAVDQIAEPAALLAAIERALAGHDDAVVYVSARSATWADLRDRLPKWQAVRLAPWSDERIRTLAEAGRAEPLPSDLIELLCTPLLLDLFLRTFASNDAVPTLATRHGVLRAYFERRVFGDSGASGRRIVLDAGVAAVLANSTTWHCAASATRELVSEGVIASAFGQLRFRHVLLRDFSAVLHLAPLPAAQIACVLREITSPIVRNELLRAVIEALLDPDESLHGPSIAELVRECSRLGLAPGIALATTDGPTPTLVAEIAPIDGGAVLRQAAMHARLVDNRVWLRVPGALGGARPHWFGDAHVQAMAELAEFAFASGDASSARLASTLREWTWGHCVGAEGPWPIATIGGLLVRSLPDSRTAEWFESLEPGATAFRSRFLEQLRDLGASAHVGDDALEHALDKIVFGAGPYVAAGGYSLWDVTHLCLSDRDGNTGLLETRPRVALGLLFKLSVSRRLEDQQRRSMTRPMLAEFFATLPPPPQDYVEAEARLRVDPTLTEGEAVGDLVDDAPMTDHRGFDYVEALIDAAARRAMGDAPFAESLARAAITSRSVHARIIVLSLWRSGVAGLREIAVEILRDRRMYHCRHASGALWDAIQGRWVELSADDRDLVRRSILERARSPLLTFADVGRLASAIPREDLGSELQPYVDFLESTGRPTAPTRPMRSAALCPNVDEDEEVQGEPSEEESPDLAWRDFQQLAVSEADPAAREQAIDILRRGAAALTAGTPDAIWSAVARVVGRDERCEEHQVDPNLARALFDGAMSAVENRRTDPDAWAVLLDLADACPSYVPDGEAVAMRRRLIAEVVAGAGENAEHQEHAWRAFCSVRPIAWLGEGTGGNAVFERWFRDQLHGDGLLSAMRLLHYVPGEARLELVRHVLEADARLDGAEGHAFINEVGCLLAPPALWWVQPWARDLVQRWCEATVRPGALASAEAWRWFVSGFAWGLQNEVRHIRPDSRIEPGLQRFVPLLELAWSAWRPVIDDATEGNISVGWSITAPLAGTFSEHIGPPAGGWSVRLRELLGRVIAGGGRNDVFAFQQVQWSLVDAETLAVVADAAVTRAQVEMAGRPSTDLIISGLIDILGSVGRHASLSLARVGRVLDCLQRLGNSTSSATSVAIVVEREMRARVG
jgi:hypothetical protein